MSSYRDIPDVHGDDEVEMQPLAPSSTFQTSSPVNSSRHHLAMTGNFRWRSVIILLVLGIAAVSIFFKEEIVTSILSQVEEDDDISVPWKTVHPTDHPTLHPTKTPTDQPTIRPTITPTFAPTDKNMHQELLLRLTVGKKKLQALLETDYGQYTNNVFNRETVMSAITAPSEISLQRLKRRLKIKVLRSILPHDDPVKFVWATTGHSAAAGHGNLFNQTYSASIEVAAREVFQAIGIDFYAKNYAMGGTASAPEVALCLPEIVGTDVDALSWDFGMTDGGSDWLYSLWTQRAGVLRSRPILFDLSGHDLNPSIEKESSAAIFTISLACRSKLPNSDDESLDVEKLPPGVRFYMCGRNPETGNCEAHKWNTNDACGPGNVRFQTSWHNGYKDHLFIGRLIATFLVEMVSDAIAELDNNLSDSSDRKPSFTIEYLQFLEEQESKDRENFLNSARPHTIGGQAVAYGSEIHALFQRSTTVACHTPRIPSDSRFKGLFTESHIVSSYLYAGKTTYDLKGEIFQDGNLPPPGNETRPMLVYDYRANCPLADIDAKDFLVVREADGWLKMTVPTTAENNFYAIEEEMRKRVGLVIMCDKQFDWNDFPGDYVSISNRDSVAITINGAAVTNSTPMDTNYGECHLMKNDDGFYFPAATDPGLDGQYEFSISVKKFKARCYMSSVIVV